MSNMTNDQQPSFQMGRRAFLNAGASLAVASVLTSMVSSAAAQQPAAAIGQIQPATAIGQSKTAPAHPATMKSVEFMNASLKMAGNIFVPQGFDTAKKYAAIVVVHPGGGVKEQIAGLYAKMLAEQ